MTEKKINLGTHEIEYSLAGDPAKPVVAFVHGLAADMRQFTKQDSFSRDYRVLRVSLRGHGGSDCPEPAGREDFTLEVMVCDIAQLLNRLDIRSVLQPNCASERLRSVRLRFSKISSSK